MKPPDSMAELVRAITHTAARSAQALPHPDLQARARRNARAATENAARARHEREQALASLGEIVIERRPRR